MKYQTYEELPYYIKAAIRDAEIENPKDWVEKKIPALGNRSLVDLVNSENGEERAIKAIQSFPGQ